MPNLKISELPSGNPAVSTDQIPIARSGANYRITLGSMGSVMANLAAWQSVQTANFTATAGKGYPVNTTSGQITVTLPASPTVGDVVAFTDYAGTFGTNKLNIDPNGNKINGSSSVYIATTNRTGLQLAYVDATQGWVCYGDTSGGVVTEAFVIQGLVVAGGGGAATPTYKGGAGGGGFRTYQAVYPASPSPGTVETGTVTVGAAGSAGANGANSVLNTITSAGGGYSNNPGGSGGGGGGGGQSGGAGNTPATTPSQGNSGGYDGFSSNGAGGGGVGREGFRVNENGLGGFGGGNNLLGKILSSSSVSTGTGSRTFTIPTGLSDLNAGEGIIATYTAASPTNIYAQISSYNSGTGALVVSINNSRYNTGPSGTFTPWTLSRAYSCGEAGIGAGGSPSFSAANTGAGGNSGVVLISVPNTASVTFSGGVTSTMTTVGTKKVYKVTATSTTSETYTVTVP